MKARIIYIASPYAGDIERNIAFARDACRYCAEQGNTPLAVHLLYPQIYDDADPAERARCLRMGLHLLERCDELWCCGDTISPGMRGELLCAKELGIPIRYVSAEEILVFTQKKTGFPEEYQEPQSRMLLA